MKFSRKYFGHYGALTLEHALALNVLRIRSLKFGLQLLSQTFGPQQFVIHLRHEYVANTVPVEMETQLERRMCV